MTNVIAKATVVQHVLKSHSSAYVQAFLYYDLL